MKTKVKTEKLEPHVESPTWGNVQRMAKEIQAKLFELAPAKAGDGGPKRGAADLLSWESFYTLTVLSSLMTDGDDPRAVALSKQKIIPDEKPKRRKSRTAR